jgi:hypothetical protein
MRWFGSLKHESIENIEYRSLEIHNTYMSESKYVEFNVNRNFL